VIAGGGIAATHNRFINQMVEERFAGQCTRPNQSGQDGTVDIKNAVLNGSFHFAFIFRQQIRSHLER